MKILQVINRFRRGGGAERFVYDLSISLSKVDNIEVSILSIVDPIDYEFIEDVKQHGIKVEILSDKLRSLSNIGKLKKVLNNHYDVVHVHLFPSLYYVAIAKFSNKYSFKLVYTEHSTRNKRRNNIFGRQIDKLIYKRYDKIVSISSKVDENLKQHLCEVNSVIINNGVDIELINNTKLSEVKKEFSLDSDSIIIAMVARFVPGKDYMTLFNSLRLLPENFHVLCIGNGQLQQKHEQFVLDDSNLSQRVHFLGLRKDVISLLKASDIIVLSSEHEGFSISMLEAMACKKPFIASEVEGLSDTVNNIAEFFPYQDANILAKKIDKLISNRDFNKKVSNRCFNFALAHDINQVAKKYISIYK